MKTIALAAIATVIAFGSQAEARNGSGHTMRQAGTLTCNMDPGVGLVFGSVRNVDCGYSYYNRKGRLVRETYMGQMKRAGFDVGVTSGQTVSWKVFTAGGRNHRGMLTGAFLGSSADASVVVGGGTLAQFGGDRNPIAFEPISTSGQVGFGIGFGATDLELRKVPKATFTALYN